MIAWIESVFSAAEFDDEAYVNTARLLAVILRIFLLFAVVIASIPLFIPSDNLLRDYSITVTFGFLLLGLSMLLRRRYVKLTSILLSIVLLNAVTLIAWIAEGLYAINGYFLVIIIVSLLLGGRATLFFGLLSILATFGLYIGHVHGRLGIGFPRVTFARYLITDLLLLVVTLLLQYANNSFSRTLTRARDGEHHLAADVREITVFKAMVDNSVDGIAMLGMNGVFVYVNSACGRLFGNDAHQTMVGQTFASYLLSDQQRVFDEEIIPSVTQIGGWRGELQIRRKDGPSFLAHITHSLVRDEAGIPIGIAAVFRDITTLRDAETALRYSAERLEIQHEIDHAILLAQSPEEIVQVALERLQDVVPCLVSSVMVFESATGIAKTIAMYVRGQREPKFELDVDLKTFNIPVLETGRILSVSDMTTVENEPESLRVLYEQGMRSYIDVPLIAQQELIGVLNLGSDAPDFFTDAHIEIAQEISASLAVAVRQAQLYEQIKQDGIMRGVLLREVNHRVGNNLMSIIGLLHTERRFALRETKDENAIIETMLDRLIQRVNGLAEVHKMLSNSSWAPVRLSALVMRLIRVALSALPPDQNVSVEVSPTLFAVSPRQANNLALVINELATNTLKYAMVNRSNGRINVEITLEENMIGLEYRDDGPGYPEIVLREEHYDVGLYLIRRFITTTLHGELSLFNDGGAVTAMHFAMDERTKP